MISLIEILNYRCLRHINRPLEAFHILVGPNASGKTTFLDVLGFMGDLISKGLDEAVGNRTKNFQDLLFARKGTFFDLAIEAKIPEDKTALLLNKNWNTIRYEISIGENGNNEISILAEKCVLKTHQHTQSVVRDLFPVAIPTPATILAKGRQGNRTVVNKVKGGNDNYYSEVTTSGRWAPSFKLGQRKSALANLPEDESKYPAATWLKSLLDAGVQKLVLNSLAIRQPSPPGQPRAFKPDGSNLPWMIDHLIKSAANKYDAWMEHLKTALPDLEGIKIIERPEDKHKYIVLCYRGGFEIPSWMASDGTLRLLALTLPAYLQDFSGVYLIEEPENGIHPRAVETMFQSLSSIYNGQILMATHSPIILSMSKPEQVLCFAKTPDGATDIISGDKHPALRDWKGSPNLSVMYAGGILG